MSWKRSLMMLAVLALAMMPAVGQAAPLAPAAGGQTGPDSHIGAGHRTSIAAVASVNLFSSSKRVVGASVAHRPKPLMHAPIVRTEPTQPAPIASVALQATGPQLTTNASFPMLSRDQAVAALGQDQNVEPPDTMLAAGPTALIEMINSSVSLWTRTGTRTALADLNGLPMPAGWSFSDPRVLFDTGSGRIFFTGLSFNPFTLSSLVFLGVSKTNDPLGGFFIYQVAQTSNGELHDQPKIGVNDDKVVISWNEFCCGIIGPFLGAETFVFEKATLLTGAVTRVFFVGPTPTQSSPVPAQSLSSTTTEYVTYNGTGFAGVLAITGTPANNNVVITETHLAMPSTSAPPLAMQPGGTINTNDDRFLSSIWQQGIFWVAGNTGCTPSGSAIVRSCMRMVKVSTTGVAPALLQAFDVGVNNLDAYYPAVTMDAAGNLFIAISASNPSIPVSAAVLDIAAGAPAGTISGAAAFAFGAQHYGGMRWGDYSAISVDPGTSKVWAAAEYSPTGSSLNWGTAAGEFSLP